jgi:RNA polymerase sigma-70 factor (ECF subfamily)
MVRVPSREEGRLGSLNLPDASQDLSVSVRSLSGFWVDIRQYGRSQSRELSLNAHSEKQLVESCRRGDRSAYASLVRAYSGRVLAICLAMLGNSHDAEDIAQQALLRGYTDISQLRDSRQFGPWISRITKNLCIDLIRSRKRKQNMLVEQVAAGRRESAQYSDTTLRSGASLRRTRLQTALARLSEDSRLVLMLYYFDGRSTKNIAEALETSQGAVQARLSRARKQLRTQLEAEGG